jgi:hypothetical protein
VHEREIRETGLVQGIRGGANGRWSGDGDEGWFLGREGALGGRELWVEGIWTGRVGTGWNIEAEGGCLIDILIQGSHSQLTLEKQQSMRIAIKNPSHIKDMQQRTPSGNKP